MKYKATFTFLIWIFVFADAINQNLVQPVTIENNTKHMTNDNQNSNPGNTVKNLIEAMSAKDAEKIRSMFHENASQAYGDSPPKSGEKFFAWLESDIIEREGHVDNPEYIVNGNQVVVKGQYSSRGYTNKANFLFSVEDGKIKSWQMRY